MTIIIWHFMQMIVVLLLLLRTVKIATHMQIYYWFRNNLLHLNLSETYYLEVINMKQCKIKGWIHYNHNYITSATHIKFLGLIIDMLSWNQHIDQVIMKLSSTTYALRHMKKSLPIDTLKIIYLAYVHTAITYGIFFWGNYSAANNVFLLQKKILRIITNKKPRDSCRELFKDLQIMTLYSQYIYSLIFVVLNNKCYLLLIMKLTCTIR